MRLLQWAAHTVKVSDFYRLALLLSTATISITLHVNETMIGVLWLDRATFILPPLSPPASCSSLTTAKHHPVRPHLSPTTPRRLQRGSIPPLLLIRDRPLSPSPLLSCPDPHHWQRTKPISPLCPGRLPPKTPLAPVPLPCSPRSSVVRRREAIYSPSRVRPVRSFLPLHTVPHSLETPI